MLFEPKLQNRCFFNPIHIFQPCGRWFGIASKCKDLLKNIAQLQKFQAWVYFVPSFSTALIQSLWELALSTLLSRVLVVCLLV